MGRFEGHEWAVLCAAFSLDGTKAITCSSRNVTSKLGSILKAEVFHVFSVRTDRNDGRVVVEKHVLRWLFQRRPFGGDLEWYSMVGMLHEFSLNNVRYVFQIVDTRDFIAPWAMVLI